MIRLRTLGSALALLASAALPAQATYDCAADAMLVFDGSASMEEIGFDVSAATRIDEARVAVRRALPSIAAVRRVGLIIYGPNSGDSCAGIDLRFAPIAAADGPIIAAVEAMRPTGLTPLSASVRWGLSSSTRR